MTGMEATKSITANAYYRGFSMLITQRDESEDLKPLVRQQMSLVDWMIEQGCQPSWNPDTNKLNGHKPETTKTQEKANPSTDWLDASPKCDMCGEKTTRKEGDSDYGHWIGYKCASGKHMGFVSNKDGAINWKISKA